MEKPVVKYTEQFLKVAQLFGGINFIKERKV